MYEPGCNPVTRSENSQHLSSWGGYTFGHWPGAVHSERAEKVDASHAVASQNGGRLFWAIYAVEWMISSTAAASSCSLCFWHFLTISNWLHWHSIDHAKASLFRLRHMSLSALVRFAADFGLFPHKVAHEKRHIAGTFQQEAWRLEDLKVVAMTRNID